MREKTRIGSPEGDDPAAPGAGKFSPDDDRPARRGFGFKRAAARRSGLPAAAWQSSGRNGWEISQPRPRAIADDPSP